MKLTWLLLTVLTIPPSLTAQELVGLCLCKPSRPGAEGIRAELEESTAVFTGRVLRLRKRTDGVVEVRVKVIESWKGVSTDEMVVTTPLSEESCGYGFRRGRQYLIYTREAGTRKMEADSCTRTKKLSEAEEDLSVLGKGGSVKEERR